MSRMRLNLYDLEIKFIKGKRIEDEFSIKNSLKKVVEYNCDKDKQDRKKK